MIKGQIISGEFGGVCIRQKAESALELGELLVAEADGKKMLLQVYDLIFGSQISQNNLELISGMHLEDEQEVEFFDKAVRNYNLALAKPLVLLGEGAKLCKQLPVFFSPVRDVTKDDVSLESGDDSFIVGKLRSGSRVLDVEMRLPSSKVLSHHVLIPASTGRGKSNLVKTILWDLMSKSQCGVLVLDPHDEYYGRDGVGLSRHPHREKLVYYTPNDPPVGASTLRINISTLRPRHFQGVVALSDPQRQAMNAYYREYGKSWVEAIILEKPLKVEFHLATLAVLKRRIITLLDLEFDNHQVYANGIFTLQGGETTVRDIATHLEQGKIVVVDTSGFEGSVELLVGAMVASTVFNTYKRYKLKGKIKDKPVVSIVLEEAPRILGKKVIEQGGNIFSTIAREGRKFNVGLIAITQLPSLIPREILANLNTKIIMGIEMGPERQAIIDNSAQDLSTDGRAIASLDKGEAIVTSTFVKFPLPIKAPLFDDILKSVPSGNQKRSFSGIKLE
ncbi:MAG: ATP-binding protein [Candidatus Nanoarchaeia archaeon]